MCVRVPRPVAARHAAPGRELRRFGCERLVGRRALRRIRPAPARRRSRLRPACAHGKVRSRRRSGTPAAGVPSASDEIDQ